MGLFGVELGVELTDPPRNDRQDNSFDSLSVLSNTFEIRSSGITRPSCLLGSFMMKYKGDVGLLP